MKGKIRLLSPALVVVALVAVACALLTYERELLWKVQEMNLFLDTPLFLRQQMVTSGWLLTWLGCWFTEFLYVPWLGVTLLTLWWALMLFVIARAFRVPMAWSAVLLVPLAAVVLMNVDLGYWIYYLKLRGHFFAAPIGTTLAVAAVWLTSHLKKFFSLHSPLSTLLYIFLSTGVLYPLIGFYGLLAAGLMGVMLWRIKGLSLSQRVIGTVVAVISIVGWPLVYYNYVFCQTNIINIWWTGLPLFVITEEVGAYYVPYYVLVASLVVMAIFSGEWREGSGERLLQPRKSGNKVFSHLSPLSSLLLFIATGYAVYHFWYKDYNFHKELRMQRCVEQLDWQGVLAEAAEADEEPTRAIVMMKNLALFRLGRQGDEMYHYRTGAKAPEAEIPVSMMQVAGYSLYYNYGLANYCHRWCLEEGVEYGWRAEYLKYLMRCALVNDEGEEARKYARLLRHTRYHREWAEKYERFIGHHDQLAADPEFAPICRMMTSGDVLTSDMMQAEKFLMGQLVNGKSDDPLYKEQSLIAALWMKDIQLFWPRFFDYAESRKGERMPTHFQEAAYLYGHLEKGVDISHMPFDDQVKRDYEGFMTLAERCAGMTEEQMAEVFYPYYGHTFYYEYYLIRNQKLY